VNIPKQDARLPITAGETAGQQMPEGFGAAMAALAAGKWLGHHPATSVRLALGMPQSGGECLGSNVT